jgi:hypothetical protein
MIRRTFVLGLLSAPLLPKVAAAPVVSQVFSFDHPGWSNLDSAAQVWGAPAVGMLPTGYHFIARTSDDSRKLDFTSIRIKLE